MKKKAPFGVYEDAPSDALGIIRKINESSFPMHWHHFFEIELITNGSVTHQLNGTTTHRKKGYICLVGPNDFHEFSDNKKLDLFNLQFKSNMIADKFLPIILQSNQNLECTLSGPAFEEVLHLVEILYLKQTRETQFLKNILNNIIYIILHNSVFSIKEKIIPEKYSPDNYIENAKMYMNLKFASNPSLDEIAEHIKISKSHLCREFEKQTGMTPKKYMNGIKLRYAQNMLHTNLPITEIAYKCGYESLNNFSKAFKAYYGVSPTEIRRQHKGT